ncbi:MAG: UDP-N-acetylglucosamine 2-epimerase (non-hydrolyzing) [Fimbriimonadaceae bacterium]|nr:UDP-N-acetylglucosamine 2-epimerase (non-hydrolyzing) [Fimbriimonadaceae bacterium]
MKIATILGTRPEIIRLSKVIELLDKHCKHTLVHTGQNYDPNLSEVFFEELGVRKPDVWWGVQGAGYGQQIAEVINNAAEFFTIHRPDRVLILGDTNSGLAALVAARLGIPVYHMEAGNRCFDNRVPEEINRRVIDQCSTLLMPYTHRSKENLLAEGFPLNRIYVTGNPIFEVLEAYKSQIDSSNILKTLGIESKRYCAVTMHRAENVDAPERLKSLLEGLDRVATEHNMPVIVSLHPRTADKVKKNDLAPKSSLVRFVTPMGFFDFVKLEKEARCVLTDSGTVQEEAAILGVPNVVIRDVTERAETIEAGSGILSGARPEEILTAVNFAISNPHGWTPPAEYLQPNVSSVVSSIVLGYRYAAAA